MLNPKVKKVSLVLLLACMVMEPTHAGFKERARKHASEFSDKRAKTPSVDKASSGTITNGIVQSSNEKEQSGFDYSAKPQASALKTQEENEALSQTIPSKHETNEAQSDHKQEVVVPKVEAMTVDLSNTKQATVAPTVDGMTVDLSNVGQKEQTNAKALSQEEKDERVAKKVIAEQFKPLGESSTIKKPKSGGNSRPKKEFDPDDLEAMRNRVMFAQEKQQPVKLNTMKLDNNPQTSQVVQNLIKSQTKPKGPQPMTLSEHPELEIVKNNPPPQLQPKPTQTQPTLMTLTKLQQQQILAPKKEVTPPSAAKPSEPKEKIIIPSYWAKSPKKSDTQTIKAKYETEDTSTDTFTKQQYAAQQGKKVTELAPSAKEKFMVQFEHIQKKTSTKSQIEMLSTLSIAIAFVLLILFSCRNWKENQTIHEEAAPLKKMRA